MKHSQLKQLIKEEIRSVLNRDLSDYTKPKESEKFDGDILRNAWFSGFHKGGEVDTNTLSVAEIDKMFQEWKSKF